MRGTVKPLTQGDVSGDCVFYSALNAVRLLWPERFSDIEACETLFGALVKRWAQRYGAVDTLLIEGTETHSGWQVALLMQDLLAEHDLHLACSAYPSAMNAEVPDAEVPDAEVPDAAAYFAWLKQALRDSPNGYACAVIGLDNPWNHWTVVRRVGLAAVLVCFFDSWGVDRLTWRLARTFSTAPGAWNAYGKTEIDVPATVIYRRIDESPAKSLPVASLPTAPTPD